VILTLGVSSITPCDPGEITMQWGNVNQFACQPNRTMIRSNVRVTVTYTTSRPYAESAAVGASLLSWVQYGSMGECTRARGATAFQVYP